MSGRAERATHRNERTTLWTARRIFSRSPLSSTRATNDVRHRMNAFWALRGSLDRATRWRNRQHRAASRADIQQRNIRRWRASGVLQLHALGILALSARPDWWCLVAIGHGGTQLTPGAWVSTGPSHASTASRLLFSRVAY